MVPTGHTTCEAKTPKVGVQVAHAGGDALGVEVCFAIDLLIRGGEVSRNLRQLQGATTVRETIEMEESRALSWWKEQMVQI